MQFVEGVLNGVMLRSRQYGMFQDVRQAGGIVRWCAKTYGVEIFPVQAMEMKNLSTRALMSYLVSRNPDVRDLFNPENTEIADHGAGGPERFGA